MSSYTDGYRRAIYEWQKRATKLQANIGFVDQFATHHWHGSKFRRFYGSRWKILVENKFDPYCDLYPDEQGLHQLTLDKPKLRDALRSYFIERQEDDNAITASAGEKPLV
jgi:arylsulfatase A-like enzyme